MSDFCTLVTGNVTAKLRFADNRPNHQEISLTKVTTVLSRVDLFRIKTPGMLNKKIAKFAILYYLNSVFQHYLQFVLSLLA